MEVGTMINDRDVMYGLERLSPELQTDFFRIGRMIAENHFEEAEPEIRTVLAHYDDQDSGIFRGMLGDVLLGKNDVSGARALFREMMEEPGARSYGLLGMAQIKWHFENNAAETIRYLDEIENPMKNIYTDSFTLRAQVLEAAEDLDSITDLLDDAMEDVDTFPIEEGAKEFMIFQIFRTALPIAAHEPDCAVFGEWTSMLGDYLLSHPPLEEVRPYCHNFFLDMTSHAVGDEELLDSLTSLADDAEEGGWFRDNLEERRAIRAMLESSMLALDIHTGYIMRRFMITRMTDEIPAAEKEHMRWLAAKRYIDCPDELSYIAQTYPNLYEYCADDCKAIETDPQTEMKYAFQAYLEDTGMQDAQRAERLLEREYDSNIYNMMQALDINPEDYPETVREDACQAVSFDLMQNIDEAAELAEDVNLRLEKPDEKMLLITFDSYLDYETPQQIRRVLREMEKWYPDSVRTRLAKGMKLMDEKKYKAAEKQLAALIPGDIELFRLFSAYMEAAPGCEKGGLIRGAFLKQLSYMKENPLPFEADRCFARYAPLMIAITDIRRRDERYLKEDLDGLKQSILEQPLNVLEENYVACWITRFCTEALDSELPWAEEAFIDLIRWCDEHDVFVVQDTLVESGYASYESYRAFRSEDTDEDMYTLVSSLKGDIGDADDAEYLAESFWRAAEKLRRDPEVFERFKAKYPHFAKGVEDNIAVIQSDPETIKHETEELIAHAHEIEPEEVRERLNLSMGIFGDDPDQRRYN